MSTHFALCLGLALIVVGYLISQFVVMVLEDALNDHETAQGPAYDARTVTWLRGLHRPPADPDSFEAWSEQAIALTEDPAKPDLKLWEQELGGRP